MGEWDAVRAASKGRVAPIPICKRCTRPSLFNPCRNCGTEAELAAQGAPPAPPPIDRGLIVEERHEVVAELPPRFADQSPVASILDGLRATKELPE